MIFLHRQQIAALSGFLGVSLGAFGAHALRAVLGPEAMRIWETAVLYHLIHTVVLLWLSQQGSRGRAAFGFVTAGILLFSGSLYIYAVSPWIGWALITPCGGLSYLAGWALIFRDGLRPPSPH